MSDETKPNAPQGLEEKLEHLPPKVGRARATDEQLRRRWGIVDFEKGASPVYINTMSGLEVWRSIGRQGSSGYVYECEQKLEEG